MKKSITLLTVAALATSALVPVIANADTISYDSTAGITFKPSTDPTPTNPVDPTNPDPDNPVKPENPDGSNPNPGTAGPLSIDFASSLDFGEQEITSKNMTYEAAAQKLTDANGNKTEAPNYVQVTDNTGSDKGWSLQVTQVAQLMAGSNELKGAQISFSNGEAVTSSASNAGLPTAEKTFKLTPGAASKVTTADAAQGQGTWVTRYGSDAATGAKSISLAVPGASTKLAQKYTSTLNWTLSQTPDANNAIK